MKIDTNIEFVGVPKTKTVIYLQQDCVKNFTELPLVYFEIIKGLYKKDKKALEFKTVAKIFYLFSLKKTI